jgi:tRNA(Glu) U13 pseudouridine synthase TruD
MVTAEDLVAEPATGGVQISVTLPSGVYATVLLREVLGLEA